MFKVTHNIYHTTMGTHRDWYYCERNGTADTETTKKTRASLTKESTDIVKKSAGGTSAVSSENSRNVYRGQASDYRCCCTLPVCTEVLPILF